MFHFGKSALRKSLIHIFKEDNGQELTSSEILELNQILEDNSSINYPASNSNYNNDEINELIIQQDIENYAHSIRMVIVSYIECLNSPFQYIIKRNIEYINEHNAKVSSVFKCKYYNRIVEYARYDMFEGEMKLLENIQEAKDLFETYTTEPSELSLLPIINSIT